MMLRPVFGTVVLLCLAAAAHGQFTSYSFTSGPFGDGFNWPAAQVPSWPTGALRGDQFDTPDESISFNNFSGNLAFFDSNNLLTRPAALINNAAWWTDVKLASVNGQFGFFETASFDIGFWNAGDLQGDFGFDVAVASVSGPVDDFIPFWVDVQEDFIFGTIRLDGSGGFEAEPNWTTQTGTFNTLNSPHPGREARIRFDEFELRDWLFEEAEQFEDGNPWSDPSEIPIQSFNLDLDHFATNGGTTQFAIDNVVVGGASPPNGQPETNTIPPIGPIGDNTPQYFLYAEAAPDGADETNTTSIPHDSELESDFNQISTFGGPQPNGIEATAFTSNTSVFFTGDSTGVGDGELAGHEVTHVSQGDPSINPGDPTQAELNANVIVNNLVNDGQGGTTRGNAPDEQVISTTTQVEIDAISGVLTGLQNQVDQTGQILESLDDLAPRDPAAVLEFIEGFSFVSQARTGAATDDPSQFFLNFSAEDYLQHKQATGDPLYEGDAGSIVFPILDDDSDIIAYSVQTWRVTNQSGTFAPIIVNIPEPTTGLLLAPLAMLLRRRRRPLAG